VAKGSAQRQSLSEPQGAAGLVLVPGQRQRLGDQLYGQILDQIVSGRLKEGERLPPEKEISAMFGVSRPVVRDALLRLRADGVLQARQGSGTYVQRRPADRLKSFANSADLAVFLRCLEVRMPLEAAAARLAAERRTARQLARIEAAHDRLRQDVETGHITTAHDLAFHASIAQATGNEFFPALLQHIHDSIAGFMDVSLNLTRTGSRSRVRQVLNEHTIIVEAIQSQEGEAAEVAMRFHLDQSRRRVMDRNRDV
jgi:GntR family transcriptional repressor for pyruvate dehydrogenase complex